MGLDDRAGEKQPRIVCDRVTATTLGAGTNRDLTSLLHYQIQPAAN